MAPKKKKIVYGVKATNGGFAVQVDNKPLKTPAGADFIVPSLGLATAISTEWQKQGEKIDPASMPLTQLAATAIDITGKDRDHIINQLMLYANSELVCHRATEPDELVVKEQKAWQPLLDWCTKKFDAELKTGSGIMPIAQSPEALAALRKALETYDIFPLTGVRQAIDASGSLVLGLALAENHLDAKEVFKAAELDSLFQMKKWGADPVIEERHQLMQKDLELCEKWFGLV